LALATFAATRFRLPFSDWKRISVEPIVHPQGDGFQSAGTFNLAVVKKDNNFVMLYRAQDLNGTSRLGYATSNDGIHFIRSANPVMHPQQNTSATGAWKIRA
jgi:predicted GH43/DUF377 family glycosyl hydrolase